MARAVPQIFFDFIREEEGCVDHVYADVAGKLTAGYGHLVIGMKVGDPVSKDMIGTWLEQDAATAAQRLADRVGADVIADLTEHQYAALLSFVFNMGAGVKWTIWARLKARQFDQVPLELMKFVNAEVDGQMVKVKGLVNRRAAEVALWATGEPGTVDTELPSSATRSSPTPPTPAAPGRSGALIASAIAGAASAPPMIDRTIDAMTKYSAHSHYVDQMLSLLGVAGAVCAGVAIFQVWRQARNARN